MIRVQIPEHNTHVDFPDGTDPAEMQRVLQENFPAKSQAIPAEAKQVVSKDLGFPASSGSRTEVMGIATPQDREAARKIRESIAGVDRSKPRTHGPTEISTAPAQNIFERGLTAVRRALSPYDNSEAMDPGDIASAQISLEAKKHTVPAKTVDLPGGAKYTFPEHSMSVPAYKKHVLPEKEGIRRVERFGLGIGQGIKGVGTGLLGAAEWAGSENAGKAATAIEANEIGNAQDTGLSGELGAGFGSMLSFLIPSTGVSKAISLTSKLSSTAAKVGGAASMAAFEGATEAGSVYRDMKRRGHSDKEASEAATKVFLANLPLNFVTDKLAFFPDHAANTALKRGLNSAVSEGTQESTQEYISERSQPDVKVDPAAILKSGAIGAITGGVTGAGVHKLERLGADELRRRETNLKALVFDSAGEVKKNATERSVKTLEAVREALGNLEAAKQAEVTTGETVSPDTRLDFEPSEELSRSDNASVETPESTTIGPEEAPAARKPSILQAAAAAIQSGASTTTDTLETAVLPSIEQGTSENPSDNSMAPAEVSETNTPSPIPNQEGLHTIQTPVVQEAVTNEPETNLKPAQKELVRDLVREYGSIEAVQQAHPTESDVDRFARFEAAKIFGQQEKAVTEATRRPEEGKTAEMATESQVAAVQPEEPAAISPVQTTETETVKQPWQMTRDEYVENFTFEPRPGVKEKAWRQEDRTKAGLVHKAEVQAAFAEGKPVPAEVLAEYPDLQADVTRSGETAKPVAIDDEIQNLSMDELNATFDEAAREAKVDKGAASKEPDFNGLLDSLQKQPDYRAWLQEHSPSNIGRKRNEVISALEIETGRNKRKKMDPYRQKILENIRQDHSERLLREQLDTMQGATETEQPVLAAETTAPGQKDSGVILDTLGLQQIYERLTASKTVKAAMADLKTLGSHVYAKGAQTWKAWFSGMKEHLGKLWDRYRPWMEKVFGEISKPAKQTAGKNRRFTFSDEEVENGIQRNRKGIRGQSFVSQLTEAAKDFAHGFTRLYKPLPRDTFFAEANKIFSDLEASKGVASREAQKKIIAVMGNMDETAADLFTKALVINDAMETREIVKEQGEDFRYPFGITEGNIEELKHELDAALEAAPDVKEAVNLYYQTTQELNDRFTEAAKALGVYGSDKTFQRNRYFHHMVMKYADKSRGTKGGTELKTRIFRDNFRKRYGSLGDINTNAVQVTFKTWVQMESDIRRMELYKELKDKYDLMPKLKRQMRQMRHRTMQGLAARVGFMDESLKEDVKRLWEIGQAKAEAFDAPEFKESTIVKLDNEFREVSREIQRKIDAYRQKLLDPDFYAKEFERFKEEWQTKDNEPFPEDVGEELFAISVRRLTEFQLALMNGDVKPFIKPLMEKAAGGRDYRLANVQDHFYRTKTIAQDMIDELLLDVAGDVVGKEHLKEILVKADPDTWVLPAEIVQTFDHIKNHAIAQSTKGKRFVHLIGGAMKRWWLFAPHNVIRYISNNTVGDTSFLFAVAPKAAVGPYLRESVGILRKMSNLSPDTAVDEQRKADIAYFFRKGGEEVGITVQEIPRAQMHKTLKAFQQRGWLDRIADLPADYLDTVYNINTFTETSRRLAAYLYFLDKWRNGEKAYGASKQEFIDGLQKIEDKAYQVANDALVNYVQTSESGRNLGDVFLFWSFREGNFKRWYHLFRNIPMDENRARVILKNSGMLAGRSTAKLTGVALVRGAQTVVMLSMLQAITTAFNWLAFPDEEDQLADEVRSKPHIILGKDKNGKILYWTSYDAMTELLSWVGMDQWVKQFKGIKDGRAQDVVWDVMLAPVNQIYGLWNPLLGKYAMEISLGKTGWPKIQDPRPMRDKLEYGAGILGLVPEYRLLTGKPSEGYLKDRGKSLLVKRADTGQVAYYQANEIVEDFLDQINKGKAYAEPNTPNARKKRDALYNLKLSIRYHDEDAQRKYAEQYQELGGTFRGLQQSIKMSHPLAAIPKKLQISFLEGLSDDQKKTVANAVEWYERIYGE